MPNSPRSAHRADIRKRGFAARQGVDNAAEKNGLGKLYEADGDGGQSQQDGQAPLGAQHAERAPINPEEVHRLLAQARLTIALLAKV